MKFPTASSYYLARQCQWPWTSGVGHVSGGKTWAARLGSLAHKLLERHIAGEPQDRQTATSVGVLYGATPRMVEVALGCYASGVRYLQANVVHQNRRAEVAVRALPEAAILPVLDRAYPDEPAIFGTADLVAATLAAATGGGVQVQQVQVLDGDLALDQLPALHVADWKTGLSSAKYVARAKWQLRTLAYAASKVYNTTNATADAVYLDKNGGAPYVSSEQLGPTELASIGADLEKTHSLLLQKPDPNPGPHCEHCPARYKCPVAWSVFE